MVLWNSVLVSNGAGNPQVGGIFFREFNELAPIDATVFASGLCLILLGCAVLVDTSVLLGTNTSKQGCGIDPTTTSESMPYAVVGHNADGRPLSGADLLPAQRAAAG